jgi:hypothetical protein
VRNIRKVVRYTDEVVCERWGKFWELFDAVSSTVSSKFMAYMYRRGHEVRSSSSSSSMRCLTQRVAGPVRLSLQLRQLTLPATGRLPQAPILLNSVVVWF